MMLLASIMKRSTFSILSIRVFFNKSTKTDVKSLNLKPLSDTKWSSRIDSLRPLRHQMTDIHTSLTERFEFQYKARHKASFIADKIYIHLFGCNMQSSCKNWTRSFEQFENFFTDFRSKAISIWGRLYGRSESKESFQNQLLLFINISSEILP